MIDVNIEQVREAFPLLANTEQKRVVLQMADEIERLRKMCDFDISNGSPLSEVKSQSDGSNSLGAKQAYINALECHLIKLRAENAELKRQSDNANNYIQSLKR